MNRSVYPTKRMALSVYFMIVIAYLIDNASRLRITTGNRRALAALYGNSSTEGSYQYYFELWTDKTGKSTPNVKTNLTTKENLLKALLSKIYNDIPLSKWTDTDRLTLNRKTGAHKAYSHPSTPITENCYATIVPLGDGVAKFSCRPSNSKSRSALPKNANGVEVAFRLDLPQIDEASNKIKRTPINNPEDGTSKFRDTKAKFIKGFGSDNAAFHLQCYTRWINSKHPKINGIWTGPFSIILL